jgi:hypothetical protein
MSVARGTEPVDVSRLDDPVAAEVDWSPVSSAWANFRTQALVELGADRLAFQPSVGSYLFYAVFVCTGTVAFAIGLGALFDKPVGGLMAMLVGGVFLYEGVIKLRVPVPQFVFDRAAGRYWHGSLDSVADDPEPEQLECYGKLSDIHALQLLSASHDSDDGYVNTKQLNLVLKHKVRHCIADHSRLPALRKDARRLGEFVGVPVWDRTTNRRCAIRKRHDPS